MFAAQVNISVTRQWAAESIQGFCDGVWNTLRSNYGGEDQNSH